MNRRLRFRVACMLFCVLSLLNASVAAQTLKSDALAAATRLFGAPDKGQTSVFDIGNNYGAKLSFDDKDRLFRIDVSPISWLNNSSGEGNESTINRLSTTEVDKLIANLSQIAPVGQLIGEQPVVVGSAAVGFPSWRYYEKAFILVNLVGGTKEATGFRIYYVLRWRGVVEGVGSTAIKNMAPKDPNAPMKLTLQGNRIYLVKQNDAANVHVGRESTFLGAFISDF